MDADESARRVEAAASGRTQSGRHGVSDASCQLADLGRYPFSEAEIYAARKMHEIERRARLEGLWIGTKLSITKSRAGRRFELKQDHVVQSRDGCVVGGHLAVV